MPDQWRDVDLQTLPGHCARRVHQLAVALFAQEVGDLNLTPVQYSSLQTICSQPGIDQKTLAADIGYDTSTIAGVIDRLEARGLLVRNVSPTDRRARQITLTPQGLHTLEAAVPRMHRSQERLLEPLSPEQRTQLMQLMQVLISANTELSKIPTRG